MTTVLLVEDDASVRELLDLALTAEHYVVVTAVSGPEAIDAWRSAQPDLVLLDLMLPGADGLEVCRTIRRQSEVPIIMLTAKTDPVDVVVGLETGADDYVVKPFETRVLLARMRAVLRRQSRPVGDAVLRFGDLAIDTSSMRVERKGREVALTPTEFRLLVELATHPDQVLSRDTLLRRIWEYDYLGDSRLIDVTVGRVRSKLEDDPSDPQLVQTRRGFGYLFVPPR
ncbi:MAG: response regulator [Acidimicrobiales bacterium]